jgi:hypothetical protein
VSLSVCLLPFFIIIHHPLDLINSLLLIIILITPILLKTELTPTLESPINSPSLLLS